MHFCRYFQEPMCPRYLWHAYYWQVDCLFNSLFMLITKKMPKLRIANPLWGEPPVTGDSPHKGLAIWKVHHTMTSSHDNANLFQCVELLVRLIPNGHQVKREVDFILDQCSDTMTPMHYHIREIIFVTLNKVSCIKLVNLCFNFWVDIF